MNCNWNVKKWYSFVFLAIFRTVMKISRYSLSPDRDTNTVRSARNIEVPYSAIRNAVAVTQSEW